MSIKIRKDGQVGELILPADSIQVLDIEGRFNSKNLEDVLKEVGSGTEENMTRIENKVEQLSNPNLLINGDFQIWQRGTSFSATNKTLYHADRWVITSRKHNITQLSDKGGLRMTKSEIDDTGWFIRQRIPKEEYSKLLGCKVTLSCKFKTDGNQQGFEIYDRQNKTVVANSKYNTTMQEGIMSHTFQFEYDGNSEYLEISFIGGDNNNNSATYYEIEWMKMECGELATPFVPRLYAEELALCQRYCQQLIPSGSKFGVIGTGLIIDAPRVYVPLTCTMRTKPTLVVSGKYTFRTSGSAANSPALTNFRIDNMTNNGINLNADFDSSATNLPSNGSSGEIWLANSLGSFLLDAEIY